MDITIKKLFKDVWKNIYKNKFTYLSIATFLQLFILAGIEIISRIFQLAVSLAGETNLNKNNIFSILTNPISFILLILLVLFVSFLMFVEFSALTFTIYGQLTENKYSLKSIVYNAWNKMRSLVGIQIIFFIGYFILTIPVANLGVKSIISDKLYIPKFITEEIMKTNIGFMIFGLIMIVFAYINLRLIFTLPLTAIGDKKIGNSIKRSWDLTRTGKFNFLATLFIFEIIYSIISIVLIALIATFFVLIDPNGENLVIQTLFYTIMGSILFYFGVISKVTVITSLITVLINKGKISEKVVNNIPEDKKKSKILLSLSFLLVITTTLYNGIMLYSNGVNEDIKVIAHRGYVDKGVENSLEALIAAKEAGANYVEVDILLTKDNKFVVMHDYNLKRLSGIDKKVQDMTFDEIVGLTISQNNFTSKIPSFDEFVAKAKELNINLLIELKPHGAEPSNYIDILIDKIKELNIEKDYKYMSIDQKVIEELELKASNLDTGYVIPLLLGKFSNTNVDFFVIEDFSYRDSHVEEAKKKNKTVYVWTINDDALITKYLQSPADGIITDRPEVVLNEKYNLEHNNSYLERLLRLLDIFI